MEEVYDLMASLLATKADEQMIGFAGFSRGSGPDEEAGEGLIKVAAFLRPDGSAVAGQALRPAHQAQRC